jgi:hypothetical protein
MIEWDPSPRRWGINTNKALFIGVAESRGQGFVSGPIQTLVTEAKGLGRECRDVQRMGSFHPHLYSCESAFSD